MTDDTDPPWVIKYTSDDPEPNYSKVIEEAAQSQRPVISVEIAEDHRIDRAGLAKMTEKALDRGVELRITRPNG